MLANVEAARQEKILSVTKGYKNYSVAFGRSLLLKTPPPLRAMRKGRKLDPRSRTTQRKKDLLRKLGEAEQKRDFYY